VSMNVRVIRKPELLGMIGLSDATVWRMERAGRFPGRITLGGNSVGWLYSEISEWLEAKAASRPGRPDLSSAEAGEQAKGGSQFVI